MNFTVLIPARFASSRLPGKVLLPLAGIPMIEHVRRRAIESGAGRVVVAADEPRIVETVLAFGGEAILTGAGHLCGSERLAEAATLLSLSPEEIIVNLQGDEPAMRPELVRAVAKMLDSADAGTNVATAAVPIRTWAELCDPGVVKVVMDDRGDALYFSRAPVPWSRDSYPLKEGPVPVQENAHFRHLGLYAYRNAFLQEYASWPAGALEKMESLEQLRILQRGQRIRVFLAEQTPMAGVDTPEDLVRMQVFFSQVETKER